MSCKCIKRIEDMLNEQMVQKYPGGEVVNEVVFINKQIAVVKGRPILTLGNKISGRMRVGKAIQIFSADVLPSYCPFCGKRMEEEDKG